MSKYYLLGTNFSNKAGIGAILRYAIMEILYAVDNNLIPVVDFKNHDNAYYKDGKKFKENTWEYFFKQPMGIGLEDISQDAEIEPYYPKRSLPVQYLFEVDEMPVSKENISEINQFKKENYKKYLNFSDEMKEYIEKKYLEIFKGEKEVLGVFCRGTDYLSLKPYKHTIQPKPKEVLKKAKQLVKTRGFKKIYLATEDIGIYELFKREFKDKLIDIAQFRYPSKVKKWLIKEKINTSIKDFQYTLARDYLASLYLLGKCSYFIGGRTSGSLFAYIFENSWEDFYIWNLGHYKKHLSQILNEILLILKYKLFNRN